MSFTTIPKAILPHEMNEIDQIFQDILRERRLPRDCEAAEDIARWLIVYFQDGIREPTALRHALGLTKEPIFRLDA